jgi:hypothetical protein
MRTKVCKNCGIEKEITQFGSNWFSKKGTHIYKPSCKYCTNLIKRNKCKDTIVIVRWQAIAIESEYKKRLNEVRREWRRRRRDHYNKKKLERYYNLPLEKKKKINKKTTDKARERRHKRILERMQEKRIINN